MYFKFTSYQETWTTYFYYWISILFSLRTKFDYIPSLKEVLDARKKCWFGLVRCSWLPDESSTPGYVGQNTLVVVHLTADMETVNSDRWQHKRPWPPVYACMELSKSNGQLKSIKCVSYYVGHEKTSTNYVQTKVLFSLMTSSIPCVLFKMNVS